MSWFDAAYTHGVPPWDIGRPQEPFVPLAEGRLVTGPVLDVGCGTGEHALLFASYGYDAVGVDASPHAIELARAKAHERGLSATFVVGNALQLEQLGRTYRTVVDCGVFHVFSDDERVAYVTSLGRVLLPGGRCYVLAFSDAEPTDWGGPRRIRRSELVDAFRDGWEIRSIEPARIATNLPMIEGHAWFAEVERLSDARAS